MRKINLEKKARIMRDLFIYCIVVWHCIIIVIKMEFC